MTRSKDRLLFSYGIPLNQRDAVSVLPTIHLEHVADGSINTIANMLVEFDGRPLLVNQKAMGFQNHPREIHGQVCRISEEHFQRLSDYAGAGYYTATKKAQVVTEDGVHEAIVFVATNNHPVNEAIDNGDLGRVLVIESGDLRQHQQILEDIGFHGDRHTMTQGTKPTSLDQQMDQDNKEFLRQDRLTSDRVQKEPDAFVNQQGNLTRAAERKVRDMIQDLKDKMSQVMGPATVSAGWDAIQPMATNLYEIMVKRMATSGGSFTDDDEFNDAGTALVDKLGGDRVVAVTKVQARRGGLSQP